MKMRGLILLLFVMGLSFSVLAQEKLKDVPGDHWAASAVYDLVRLGITKGYPDGTFRGNKPITRYETAIFLSKLAKAVGVENIKADLEDLKNKILDLKKETMRASFLKGQYFGDWRVGNVFLAKNLPQGVVGSYRLILSSSHKLSEGAELKINLDTMDYGYFDDGSAVNAGRGLLASELLDVESRLKLSLAKLPLELRLTYGPGPRQHSADPTGVLPGFVGVTYMRPSTGIAAETKLLDTTVSFGYYSLSGQNFDLSGKVNTGLLTGSVTFNLPVFIRDLKLVLTGDYVSRGLFSSGERDLRAKIDLFLPMGEKAEASGHVGMGGNQRSEMMAGGKISLKDPFDTGTVITLQMAKIGSSYINSAFAREEFYFAGLDNFDRPLVGGVLQIGGVLTQNVSDKLRLIGKGDVRLSGDYRYEGSKARLTAEGGIYYDIAPNAHLGAAYRVDKDRATGITSDLTQVGLMYHF